VKRSPGQSRLAAEMYLAAGGNGHSTGVTLKLCADRHGVSIGTVHEAVRRIRKRQERAAHLLATPEDECSL
jgi:hypothetical protein